MEAEIHGPPVRTAYVISRLGDRYPRAVIRAALLELLRAGRIERILDREFVLYVPAPPNGPHGRLTNRRPTMTRKSHTTRSIVDTILRGAVDPNVVVAPIGTSVDGQFRGVPVTTLGANGMRTRSLYCDDGGDLEAYRADFLRALVERPVTVHVTKTVCEAARRCAALWPGVESSLKVAAR